MLTTSDLFYVSSGSTVLAFERSSGREVWWTKLGSFWSTDVTMALADDEAVYALYGLHIYRLNALNGEVLWEKKVRKTGYYLKLLLLPGSDPSQQQVVNDLAKTSSSPTSSAVSVNAVGRS